MDVNVLKNRGNHDMLVVENVRLGARSVAMRVVVAPDRRVISALEESGLWGAYRAISEAIKIRTQGLGARTFDPSRVTGCSSGVDNGAELLQKYDMWYRLCAQRHLAPILVRKMIIDGLSMNAIDKEFKFYKGATKIKIWECLKVWDEV